MSWLTNDPLEAWVRFVRIHCTMVVRFGSRPGTNWLGGVPFTRASGMDKSIIKIMLVPPNWSWREMSGGLVVITGS